MAVEWSDLGVALGLLLALEGAVYAFAPDLMRRLLAMVLTEPVPRLRVAGVASMIAGLAVIWLIRG